MTYKQEDWQTAKRRLARARSAYESYMGLSKEERQVDDLDSAVFNCWSFGEYAVNVALECSGGRPVQNHQQAKEARALCEAGVLAADYSPALEKLERFRKKAAHLGYVREKSTHYSSADVLRCLVEMEKLVDEVQALLVRAGRIS